MSESWDPTMASGRTNGNDWLRKLAFGAPKLGGELNDYNFDLGCCSLSGTKLSNT